MALVPQYGVHRDRDNSRVALNYSGTRRLHVNSSGVSVNGTLTSSGAVTVTTGDANVTAGNLRMGPINAFASTEPTQALVLEAGTAPAGAITTSGGIFSSATVVRKIIADGTVSDVET
jgi:hypothetical protein